MRIEQSTKNICTSLVSQVILTLLGFVSRKIFLDNLGVEYLGVNGLLTNVLSMLGLIEGGIGLSIVYNLYKPLAEDDKEKIIGLVQLYKKAYGILSLIVFVLSIVLYQLLDLLIKGGESIPYITIVYYIFVAKNIVSYLNAHKWSLIQADQKGYILARANLIFQILITISKIIVISLTQNYILYLLIELLVYIFQMIYNGIVVNKRYAYIKTKERYTIDELTKGNLIKNVKALFLHNIGAYCVFGTDNILISSYISLTTVGLYSNYTMIIGQLTVFVSSIFVGVGASVGNLIVTENSNKNYSIFKVIYLVNFWIYSVCSIFLFNLLEPFINWWIGNGYLLDRLTFTVIIINFYLTGLRTAIGIFKNKAGLFVQDKYTPLMEGLINLVSSIILIKYFGLAGVFIGTTISTISIVLWNQPRIVYKHIFNKPLWSYFTRYILYMGLTIFTCFVTTNVCELFVVGESFISLIGKGTICIILPNILYITIFYKTEEFKYLLNAIKMFIPKFKLLRVN